MASIASNCLEARQMHQICPSAIPTTSHASQQENSIKSDQVMRTIRQQCSDKTSLDACTKFPMRFSCSNMFQLTLSCSPPVTQEAPPNVCAFSVRSPLTHENLRSPKRGMQLYIIDGRRGGYTRGDPRLSVHHYPTCS